MIIHIFTIHFRWGIYSDVHIMHIIIYYTCTFSSQSPCVHLSQMHMHNGISLMDSVVLMVTLKFIYMCVALLDM